MKIIINEEIANQRVDIALSKASEFSRSMIQKMIYANKIKNGNELVKKANEVTELDQVYEVEPLEANITYIKPEKGNLDILFEDEHLLVINKDAQIIVHPGAGNPDGTLINQVAHYLLQKNESLSDFNGTERLGVVHRLDKGVSGCIIIAKTNQAHIELAKQFQERTVKKKYIAICYDLRNNHKTVPNQGIMEDYIARGDHDRKKMVCLKKDETWLKTDLELALEANFKLNKEEDEYKANFQEDLPQENNIGKYAKMEYKIEPLENGLAKIHCLPHTGRMHQIRVQLASRGLPIVGDLVYGRKQDEKLLKILGKRIALHAAELTFMHPINKTELSLKCELPRLC